MGDRSYIVAMDSLGKEESELAIWTDSGHVLHSDQSDCSLPRS